MTGLIITGIVLSLFAVLLFCSVFVEANFEEEFSARIGFLFLHYRLLPRPEEKPTEPKVQKKEKPAPEEKPSKIKELFRQKGLGGFLELLKAFTSVAYTSAKKLLSHTIVRKLSLDLTVGGDDAAQTALNYGRACGAVSTALTALLSVANCKERNVTVAPDFQNGENRVRFRVRATVRLFFLFSAALSALTGFIKVYLKYRKKSGHPDQKEKAVL
ncbi:DUF2953 domain-containing protein [Caproicibacter sp.]|uniref:DUF2953 domain-containing protein n=1 Tax=Caproicibacter sp. TaxID=2814884 RepID=UPI003988BC57